MRTIKLVLRYDGTAFCGWQAQPGQRTVQGTISEALARIVQQPVELVGSSRTDSGVHALGQVAHWQSDTHLTSDVLFRALRSELPDDVQVVSIADAPPDFHAIRDAARKRYRYVLTDGPDVDLFRRNYLWHVRGPLDVDAMHRAGQALRGQHDFRSYHSHDPQRQGSVRTVLDLIVRRAPEVGPHMIYIEAEADGFLYHMVRALVGTLVEVGRGAQAESWPAEVLTARDRSAAGPTAPPQGLFLLWIDFADRDALQSPRI